MRSALPRSLPAELRRRLERPLDLSHLVQDDAGRPRYRIQRQAHLLEVPEAQVRELVDAAGDAEEVLLFGVGSGELLPALLAARPGRRVRAWERDPSLLRLALSRQDLGRPLASGRLTLGLGADLKALAPTSLPVVDHPLLVQLYAGERRLLEQGFSRPLAMLCEGGLMVADTRRALEGQGHDVYTLDTRLPLEELEHSLRRLAPEALWSINYQHGLAELGQRTGVPVVVWEIDPSVDRLHVDPAAARGTRVFTYRRAHIESFAEAGFPDPAYLPLAADTTVRRPPDRPPADAEGPRVAYVAASLVDQSEQCRARFLALAREHAGGAGAAAERTTARLDRLLELQALDLEAYRVPLLMATLLPDLVAWAEGAHPEVDPVALAGTIAGATKRLEWVRQLGHVLAAHGAVVDLWGDAGWHRAGEEGVRYHGLAGHRTQLTQIYGQAVVNVDIGRIYQEDMVTLRVFEVLACGGFLLTPESEALRELFSPGEHLETYRTFEELASKAAWYAARPAQARAVGTRGLARVQAHHATAHRVAEILGRS